MRRYLSQRRSLTTHHGKRRYCLPVLLCALICLTACGGRSPQPNYYLLAEEGPTALPAPGKGPAVVLRQVTLPPYLDREALVLRSADSVRISVSDAHLWAEALHRAVPRLLEESMRPILREKGLELLWPDAAEAAALHVDLALLRLDGIPGGRAELRARWRIADRTGAPLDQGLFARDMDAGSDHESMVRALSRLLADCGRALALAAEGASGRVAASRAR